MAPKILITGATGYIGGDILYALSQAHPDYEYVILARTQEKADLVKQAHPQIRIVLADLDDSDTLKQEAAKADVVIHNADASDHEGAARALLAGLLEAHSEETPGFYLHTSGTGILTWEDTDNDNLGQWTDKQYNDWEGVGELTSLPDHAFHRNVDKIVLEAGEKHGAVVKTAIVCPPTIYGTGRGAVSGRSRQVYELASLILSAKYIPIIGDGKARWDNVHVWDLSQIYVLLTEAAIAQNLDTEIWGQRGYILTGADEHVWSDIAVKTGEAAEKKGYVKPLEKRGLSKEAALKQAGFTALSWGLNSRGKSERAKKVLGWKPSAPSLEDTLPEIVEQEYKRQHRA